MYCPKCGREVKDQEEDALYCRYCGASLALPQAPAPAAPAPAPTAPAAAAPAPGAPVAAAPGQLAPAAAAAAAAPPRATLPERSGVLRSNVQTFEAEIAGPTVYAGFWRRLGAFVVDWVVLSLLILLAAFLLGLLFALVAPGSDPANNTGWGWLIVTLISLLYYPLQESSSAQATVGKRVFSIMVTDSERRRISFRRALGRYLAKVVSGMTLGIGYLMAGFTARKQALHDMLADTLVVMRPN